MLCPLLVCGDGNGQFFSPYPSFFSIDYFNAYLSHRYVGKFVRKNDRVLANPDAKYTNLYFKNLDPDVTEDLLQGKFLEFGTIASLVISKDENGMSRGFGFVNFESPENAKRALEALNGSLFGRSYFSHWIVKHGPTV